MPKQIGYVIGSLRKDSYNRKLAGALVKLGPPDFTFKELRIGDLPLYNQDDDRSQAAEVQRFKSELRAVDAVIFVTAEYNRSIPGVLKNAIDHASRPYGQNAWAGKARGHHRRVDRRHRHRGCPVPSAHRAGLHRHASAAVTRGVHHGERRFLRRCGEHHEPRHAQIPARLDGQVCGLGEAPHGLRSHWNICRVWADI